VRRTDRTATAIIAMKRTTIAPALKIINFLSIGLLYIFLYNSAMNFIVGIFGFLLSTQLGKHFFFPFSYLSGIRVDYLAPTLYAMDLISFVLLGSLFHEYRLIFSSIPRLVHKYMLSISIGLLCIILNFLLAPSKELWIYTLLRLIQWIGVFIFFARYGARSQVFVWLIWGIMCGAVIQLFLTLTQLSTRQSMQGIMYWLGERQFSIATPSIAKAVIAGKEFLRPYGSFSHPNSLAGFYLLLYSFVLTQKNTIQPIVRFLLLLISSALVVISFSRAAIVVYAVVNLVYFLQIPSRCKWCVVAKTSVVAFLFIIAFSISGDTQSFDKRLDFTHKAISIILQNPTTGTGLGGYLIAQHEYPQKFPIFFEQPVHSIYLYTIAQLGIPLSFLIFSYIALYIRPFLRYSSFVLPVLAVATTGAIDHYWLTLPQNLFLSATIFGILIATHEK